MKIIGMILDKEFPPDIRVEKEVKELVKAGFIVHLLCLFQPAKPLIENINGVIVHRKLKKNLLTKTINRVFIIKYCWLNTIKKFISDNSIDILHIHDLPMVASGIEMKKDFPQVKVIADLHENYPAAVEQWLLLHKDIKTRILKTFFMNYQKMLNYEKKILKKVDHIIAVVDEMKDRIVTVHKISPDKITVVSNLEDIDFFEKAEEDKEIIDRYNSIYTILYIGGFGVHRGLDTAIRGMRYIKKKDIKLLLVGRGSREVEEYFVKIIEDDKLQNKVEIVGWQHCSKVYSYMKSASVCVIPHNSNEHTDNTIPHKLYQYMMVGKPVVVSSCKPLARVVNEAKSGLIFEANNPEEFANKIIELYKDKEKSDRLAKNGLVYTFEKENTWQSESKKLIKLYKEI